jgi:ParB/RepB/Spo0J family partition protein
VNEDGSVSKVNTTPEDTQRRVIEKRGRVAVGQINLRQLVVEYVPIGSIKPNGYNPNRQTERDFELLLRSMEEDGFTQPIVVHRETREIVDGEHRWRAAKTLGLLEVPVVLVDMTVEQMRVSTLRHNRARGSEDIELSAAVLRDLQELGAIDWAQDSLMLSDDELNRMLNETNAPDALAGEDFSDAWVPVQRPVGSSNSSESVDGHEMVSSASSAAAAGVLDRDASLANAHTESERQTVLDDMRYVRITIAMPADRAEVVMRVLGEKMADRLLELCEGVA